MKTRKLLLVLKDGYKQLGRKEKIVAILVAVFVLLGLFLLIGCLVGALVGPIRMLGSSESHSLLYYGILSKPGLPITVALSLAAIVFALMSGTTRDLRNTAISQDETGMILMEKSTFGDAHFMSEAETRQILRISDESETDTTIYGQLTSGGEKVVSFMPNSKGATGNFNEAVIGGSGSGKSSCYAIMKIVKAILRGESIVCTDPKGELYRLTAYFAKIHGYKVQILNMKYPKWTDCWDCLAEVIDPDTGRLDATSLNDFVNIYMKNSTDGNEQPFFYNNAASLLKAAIGYCAWMRESTIVQGFKDLFFKIAEDKSYRDEVLERFDNDISFDACEDMIMKATNESKYRESDIENAIKQIYEFAPMFTIAQVYHTIVQFDDEIKSGTKKTIFDNMPNDHPGKMAYDAFKKNTKDSVKGGAEQGIMQRFALFTDKYLRTILSNDGIHISEIRKSKTIVYVIIDDAASTTKPIVSLFFSFLLRDCQKQWDEAENDFDDINGEHEVPLLPVTIILDELYSCGVIGSEEKTLPQTLSVARSKKLNFGLILQGYDQLMDIYGESNRNNILGQCSTKIFLGRVDDEATTNWISFLTGEATVMNETHVEALGVSGIMQNADQVNASAARRYLLTPAQVAKWKDEVLFFKGGEVGRYNTFHWKDSVEYKSGEMKNTSFKREYQSLDQVGISNNSSFVVDPFRQKDFSTKKVANESLSRYKKICKSLKEDLSKGVHISKPVKLQGGEQLAMTFGEPEQKADEDVYELELIADEENNMDKTEELPVFNGAEKVDEQIRTDIIVDPETGEVMENNDISDSTISELMSLPESNDMETKADEEIEGDLMSLFGRQAVKKKKANSSGNKKTESKIIEKDHSNSEMLN